MYFVKSLAAIRLGFLSALLVAFLGSGCAELGTSGTANAPQPQPTTPQPANPGEEIDKIQIGDQVVVSMTDVPDGPPAFQQQVRTDGKITLLQGFEFVAAGKKRQVLEREIENFYVQEKQIYKRMTVSVAIPPRFFNIGGEVRGQGQLIHPGQMTVVKAIHAAGGFTDYAKKTEIQVTRAVDKSQVIVNYKKAIKDPRLDVPIYPGDLIYVPKTIL